MSNETSETRLIRQAMARLIDRVLQEQQLKLSGLARLLNVPNTTLSDWRLGNSTMSDHAKGRLLALFPQYRQPMLDALLAAQVPQYTDVYQIALVSHASDHAQALC